jgi:hypothetical protein
MSTVDPNLKVEVRFRKPKVPAPNQIRYNGIDFDCNDCSKLCCSTAEDPCRACSCNGRNSCTNSDFCKALGIGNQDYSPGSEKCYDRKMMFRQQPVIYFSYDPKDSGTFDKNKVTCEEARTVYTNQGLLNLKEVKSVCENPNFSVDCCRQRSDVLGVSIDSCNVFWGGTGDGTTCDIIMKKFCDKNPDDISCGCLSSKLPLPFCTDDK